MSALIAALGERHGIPTVDAASAEAFLAPAAGEAAHALLFFTGDAAQRPETPDVAVVLPELLAAFPNRLRAAVVAREAEEALKARFRVTVFPSLAVTRGTVLLGVMARIREWSDYLDTLQALLAPDAPPMAPAAGPAVRITHVGRSDA
jgi:hydrogenase-1 operon protein HyaE